MSKNQYIALSDITNVSRLISKDHGIVIIKGDIIEETKANKERLERLAKINSVKLHEEKAAADPDDGKQTGEQTPPADPPKDPEGEKLQDPPADPDNSGQEPPTDDNQDDDGQKEPSGEINPDQLTDDIEQLKAFADKQGITYAPNIGVEKLKSRILEHVEEQKGQE